MGSASSSSPMAGPWIAVVGSELCAKLIPGVPPRVALAEHGRSARDSHEKERSGAWYDWSLRRERRRGGSTRGCESCCNRGLDCPGSAQAKLVLQPEVSPLRDIRPGPPSGTPTAARSCGRHIMNPRSALCRLHRFSSKLASTNMCATDTMQSEGSEFAIRRGGSAPDHWGSRLGFGRCPVLFGCEFGREADVKGPHPIRPIGAGPPTSTSRPNSEPERLTIVQIRASSAHVRAKIWLINLRAGDPRRQHLVESYPPRSNQSRRHRGKGLRLSFSPREKS